MSKINKSHRSHRKFNSFRRKLTLNIIFKFAISLFAYMILLIVLLVGGYIVSTFFVWYGDEFIYKLLKPIRNNPEPLLLFLFAGGAVFFIIYYFRKTLGYLELMTDAMENIYNENKEPIRFPPELEELEKQANQIKMNVIRSQAAAKEAEQRKNDLVVYLAHDLKTPLTSVIGYLSLLSEEESISDELRKKYISISLEKAERLEILINEFFDITRFNITNIPLDYSRIDLIRMLEQLVFEFKPMLAEKSLKCTLEAPDTLKINVDADKIQRVFDNLMKNAVNYSTEDTDIVISVISSGEYVSIVFLNSGNTISNEKLSRIFDRFYRLDSSRSSVKGGAGLGLAIAKEIVERHKGTINAESYNNKIKFTVTLPTEQADL